MSIVEPKIHELLKDVENDRFLLSTIASKRARDINDMMRGQRLRAISADSAKEIAKESNLNSLTMAFNEIANGDVSYDPASIDATKH